MSVMTCRVRLSNKIINNINKYDKYKVRLDLKDISWVGIWNLIDIWIIWFVKIDRT